MYKKFIILIVFSSWFLLHIFAIFGFFLAIAYPLWWLLSPKRTVCLMCRAQKEGSRCPLCKRIVAKKEGFSPQNLRSAVLNGGLIFVFSLVSVIFVFIEAQLFLALGFPPTTKTASFVIPSNGQYRVGEIFPMKIAIENIDNPINAIQTDIGFDPKKVEVVYISTKDSFANIFLQKEINNTKGWARLTGGIPNPGWNNKKGTFGVIYFKTKSPGLVSIKFLPSSMILANDKNGTNILKKQLPDFSYLILPEKISAEETAKQKELLSRKDVMGASTVRGQMNFYKDEDVLVTQMDKETKEEDKETNDVFRNVVTNIVQIDTAIVTFWKNIL